MLSRRSFLEGVGFAFAGAAYLSVAVLTVTPWPIPLGTIATVKGAGFSGNRRTRLRLDSDPPDPAFRARPDGTFTRALIVIRAATTLYAEQYSGGRWTMVARLTPLLTFGPAVVDTTPPVVTGVAANQITSTSANISWTTNEQSSSQVDYGTTTGYLLGPTTVDNGLVTTHNETITGLTASTLYHYRVRSTDRYGNAVVGVDGTFTTLAVGVSDTTAPVISNIVATPSGTSVTISWDTDENANARFDYGTTLSYGQSSPTDSSFTQTYHSLTATGLSPNTTYYYRVRSADAAGNVATASSTSLTYSQTVIADGATAYLKLGEPSGTTAADSVGASTGTYVNTPTLGVAGLLTADPDTAATFAQASDEYVTIPQSAPIAQADGDFSWELWYKPGTLDATSRHLMMKGAVGSAAPDLLINGTSHTVNFRSDGWGTGVTTAQALVTGNTYHIVGTKSAAHVWRLYINGIEDSTAQANAQTADDGNPLLIGRKAASSTNNADGTIEKVAVYKGIVLTPTQVASHYGQSGITGGSFTTTGGTYTASGPITVSVDNQIIEFKIIDSMPGQTMTIAGETTGTAASILVNGKSGVIIRNCILRGRQWGILAVDANNLTITDCTITDVNYCGIGIFGGTGGSITRPTIQRVGTLRGTNGFPSIGDAGNSYGIKFEKASASGLSTNTTPPTTWFVDGFLIEDVPLWQGVNAHQASNLTIQNGIVRRCPRPVFVSAGTGEQLDHVNILNNQLLEAVTKAGGTTDKSAISYGFLQTGTISGNSLSTTFTNSINNIDAFSGGASTSVTIGTNPSVP